MDDKSDMEFKNKVESVLFKRFTELQIKMDKVYQIKEDGVWFDLASKQDEIEEVYQSIFQKDIWVEYHKKLIQII